MPDISTADILVGMATTAILMFLGYALHNVLFIAQRSRWIEDITMYQTHIGHLETQRYAALPVVRQLSSLIRLLDHTHADRRDRINELLLNLEQYIVTPTHYRDTQGAIQIPDLAILRMLADIWQRQVQDYPDTEEGLWSMTATNLCAQELLAVLDDDKDFVLTSMLAGIRALKQARS